jgi:NAD(P)H-dependent FMN reductase
MFTAGSARTDSVNKKLARLGAEIATAVGIAATFVDPREYPMPLYDGDLEDSSGVPESVLKFEAVMSAYDGVLISCPEYNSAITPLLKNTLDWMSRIRRPGPSVFKSRVFALGAAVAGGFGGVRGIGMARQTLEIGLGALVIPEQILIPHAHNAFDEQGHLKEKFQQDQLKAVIERLAHVARAMKAE